MYDIEMVKIDENERKCSGEPLLPGAIPGVSATLRLPAAGEKFTVPPRENRAFIFFLLDGNLRFSAGGTEGEFSGRHVFIPSARQSAEFLAGTPARILQIEWEIPESEREQWNRPQREFPYIQEYSTSVQYRDPNKSDKTISREIVRQRIVPGFCMGSVESRGCDKVAQHPHPMLDQFFFSFPENDIDVLIDDFRVRMKGDTLLHIPLGSNHGAEVCGENRMHYIWIDFFLEQAGLDRLDSSHRPTGRMRSF